jgi:hypothetical protein
MDNLEITGKFSEVDKFQEKYHKLVEVFDELGSRIITNRRIEKDSTVKDEFGWPIPHIYYESGNVEYIFPKQIARYDDSTDKSRVWKDTPDYVLWTEKSIYTYNKNKVKGRIKIEYEDANCEPYLSVKDVLKNSVLPAPVLKILEDVFRA